MQNRGLLFIGGLVILLGLLMLISNLTGFNFWAILGPLGLILFGIWLLLRPRLLPPDSTLKIQPFGDIKRSGDWQVEDEEFWIFVGDVRLDMTQVNIPLGETRIKVYGFVGSVRLILPQEAGFWVSSTAFLTDGRITGRKREAFVTTIQQASDDYQAAERKIRLETVFFVLDLDVEQP